VLRSLDERRFIAKQKKKTFMRENRRGLIGSITLILSFEEATVLSHVSVEKMERMKEGTKEGRKKSIWRQYLIANLEQEKNPNARGYVLSGCGSKRSLHAL
jgi:hypothetical protein